MRRHFVDLDRLNQFEQTTNLIINICRTILNIFEPIDQDELNAIMNQMGSFEEQDPVKSIFSNPDFTNIQINTIDQLVALWVIFYWLIKFLSLFKAIYLFRF